MIVTGAAQLEQALSSIKTSPTPGYLEVDELYCGDARELLRQVAPDSVALSVWSPPYFVGKEYESYLTYDRWESLLREVIHQHTRMLKPGGFLAVNIADILCFKDASLPRIQAEVVSGKRLSLSREDILEELMARPKLSRYDLAKHFGVSEQTIDRRLHGNGVRGGKHDTQTRVKIVGGLLEQWAYENGLVMYDRRVWVKDPAWANSRWSSVSYRAVDEFEYIYIFWKPGPTRVDKNRLSKEEWTEWGSRAVWNFPSVRANDDHEAKFPIELPRRLIRLLTDENDTVVDCFVGSGTTAIAAKQANRHYLGFDLEEKYVKLAQLNIAKVPNAPN